MLRQQRELCPNPPDKRQEEKCGVHPLRTSFINLPLSRDNAAFATFRSDLKPVRISSERSFGLFKGRKVPTFGGVG